MVSLTEESDMEAEPIYYSTAGYQPGETVRIALQTLAARLAPGTTPIP